MAVLSLNLPQDVPWKLIAASPDMIDTEFCNSDYPPPWRSSIAISVYEPKLDDLPDGLCDERVTYLKVTCTITGYQASRQETRDLDNGVREWVPAERLQSILQEYFACYGVLLNVSVFPFSQRKRVQQRVEIDFADYRRERTSTTVDNPLELGGATFRAKGRRRNRIVDLTTLTGGPPVPSGYAGLDLSGSIEITFPESGRVEAKLISRESASVTMEAYNEAGIVGSQTTDTSPGAQQLAIDGDQINRVILRPPSGGGYLLEFNYDAWQDVPFLLSDFPHIIDFEPKVRDLYQAATESGEILSASVSSVKTDKSFTHTETSETGLSVGAKIGAAAGGLTAALSGTLAHKWGETDQDRWMVQTDASRDRRERNAVTTNLSQMYNLLTGYHAGTNRAAFLMLPRPHILQPTDHRTFIQGLRIIEGVQEFFLIVSRPAGTEGLSVEATLETGHFPEHVEVAEPPIEYEESSEEFSVTGYIDIHDGLAQLEKFLTSKYTVGQGWVIDRRLNRRDGQIGDRFHPGIIDLGDFNDPEYAAYIFKWLVGYNYLPIDDSTVQVSGTFLSATDQGHFNHAYRVLTRSEQPKPGRSEPVVSSPFLITSRSLCTAFSSGEDCPEVIPIVLPDRAYKESIVDERVISLSPALLTRDVTEQTRLPAIKETLRQIHFAMTTSGRLPRRRPYGSVGFSESDYVKDRLVHAMSTEMQERRLDGVTGLPRAAIERLGEASTVREALSWDLTEFAGKTGISIENAVRARRILLGLSPEPPRDDDGAQRLPAPKA